MRGGIWIHRWPDRESQRVNRHRSGDATHPMGQRMGLLKVVPPDDRAYFQAPTARLIPLRYWVLSAGRPPAIGRRREVVR